MKNDENVIRCADCPMMQMMGYEKITSSNFYMPLRGKCFCEHPDAEQIFKECCSKSSKMPRFIALTKPASHKPAIKTTPRWCPRKQLGDDRAMGPKEISKAEAYSIIGTLKPRGLFYLKEGNGYTGIDNVAGDTWVEEFSTKQSCLKWLMIRGEQEKNASSQK